MLPPQDDNQRIEGRLAKIFFEAHGHNLASYAKHIAWKISGSYDLFRHVDLLNITTVDIYLKLVKKVFLWLELNVPSQEDKIRLRGAAAVTIRQMVRKLWKFHRGFPREDAAASEADSLFLDKVQVWTSEVIPDMRRGLENYIRSISDHVDRSEADRVRKWALVAPIEHLLAPFDLDRMPPMLPTDGGQDSGTATPSSACARISYATSTQTTPTATPTRSRASSCDKLPGEVQVQAMVFDSVVTKLRQVIIEANKKSPGAPSSWRSSSPSPLPTPRPEQAKAEAVSMQDSSAEDPEISQEKMYDSMVDLAALKEVLDTESKEKAKRSPTASLSASSGSSWQSC